MYIGSFSFGLEWLTQESFDWVILWTTLSHIPREQHTGVYSGIERCLVNGGRLLVFDNDLAGVSMDIHPFDLFKAVIFSFSNTL